jgi:hypothetical protein
MTAAIVLWGIGAAAQSEGVSPEPAGVTGTTTLDDFSSTITFDGGPSGHREETSRMTFDWTASDPRLSGRVEATQERRAYAHGTESVGTTRLSMANRQGTWAGNGTTYERAGRNGVPPAEGGGVRIETAVLAGAGAYEGLTAYLVIDHASGTFMGILCTGAMPAPSDYPGLSVTESPAPITTPPTAPLAPLPPAQEEPVHGGDAWAVYLALSTDISGPEIADAIALLEDLGYVAGWAIGDLACDQGGAQAVGVDPSDGYAAVRAYFETVLDAARFVVALDARGHSVLGIGLVQTYCLD